MSFPSRLASLFKAWLRPLKWVDRFGGWWQLIVPTAVSLAVFGFFDSPEGAAVAALTVLLLFALVALWRVLPRGDVVFRDPPKPFPSGSARFVRVEVVNEGPETVRNAHGQLTLEVDGEESRTFQMRWTGSDAPKGGIVHSDLLLKDLRPKLPEALDVAVVLDPTTAYVWDNHCMLGSPPPQSHYIDADHFHATVRVSAEGEVECCQRIHVWSLSVPRVDVVEDY